MELKTIKLAAGALLFTALVAFTPACNSGGGGTEPTPVATPTPAPTPTPAVVSAPAPAPTPVPTTPDKAWEIWGTPSGVLHVKYTGSATYAQLETYYTSFDDQTTKLGLVKHDVKRGDEITREFGKVCIQGDAEQINVKPIGGVFFDKNGAPFNPSRNPEKVAECRRGTPTPPPPCQGEQCEPTDVCPNIEGNQETVPEGYYKNEAGQCVKRTPECEPTWKALDPKVTTSEYGQCSIETGKKSRTVRTLVEEVNSCTEETRVKSDTTVTEYLACVCADYDKSVINITGSLSVTLDGQKYSVVSNVSPSGGSFDPALLTNQDLSTSFTFNTTYTKSKSYGPPSLQCSTSASAPFSVIVPGGSCYYEVKGQNKQTKCLAQVGFNPSWNPSNNQCTLGFPGTANDDFLLTPGQSAKGCKKKNDD